MTLCGASPVADLRVRGTGLSAWRVYLGDALFRSQYPGAAGKTVWQRVAWGAPSSVSAAARQTA
jgi:hypothetical protein